MTCTGRRIEFSISLGRTVDCCEVLGLDPGDADDVDELYRPLECAA